MADGFSLTIDDSMLKKLDDADKKLAKLADTMDATSKRMIKSFQDINSQGLDVFMNKINDVNKVISSLGNKKISISSILGGKSQTAKSVDDINKLIELLNKLSQETKKTQGANKRGGLFGDMSKSVSDWQALQKQISDNEKQISKLTQSTREYESTMKRIQSGKGGVIHGGASKEYQENLKNIESLKQQNALLQQKQQLIIQNNQAIQAQVNLRQQLKQYNQQQGSLPEQRKADELKRMNDYYRELEKSSKKAADEATKAADKETEARKRAERASKKQAEAEAKRQQRAAQSRETQILNAYNQAMKANEATVNQRINKLAKLRQVESQLAQDEAKYSSQLSRVRSEIDRLSQANDKAAKSTKQLQSNQRNLMDTTGQLQRKLALLFSVSAIQGYVSKLVEVRGEFEMQQRSLQVLLQNKDEANELWDKTVALAVKSPFRVKELVTYTKQLAAYRVESDKLFETNKMLADVSAGLGVDMNRLILAFGQVKAANYLRGTELRQFSEAGVNMLGELAKYFTELEGRAVSVGDVFERISKRMVTFQDVNEIFRRITSEGGIFFKMQEKQSETLRGMVMNFKDSMDLMLNDIGKDQDSILKNSVRLAKEFVDNWRQFQPYVETAGVAFLAAFGVKTLGGIIKGVKNLMSLMIANPWTALASVVALVVAYIYNASEAQNKLNAAMREVENENLASLEESIGLYKQLTETINDTTKSYEERDKAMSQLKSKFNEILPDQYTELKYVEQLGGNYRDAEQAMLDYYNAKTREQKKARVEQEFASELEGVDITELIASYRKFVDGTNMIGIDESRAKLKIKSGIASVINSVVQDIKSGTIPVNDIQKEISSRLEKFVGDDIIAKSIIGKAEKYGDIKEDISDIIDTLDRYAVALSNIDGLEYETYDQKEAARIINQEKNNLNTAVNAFKKAASLYQKYVDAIPDATGTVEEKRKKIEEDVKKILTDLPKEMTAYSEYLNTAFAKLKEEAEKGTFAFASALQTIESELYASRDSNGVLDGLAGVAFNNVALNESANDAAKQMVDNFKEGLENQAATLAMNDFQKAAIKGAEIIAEKFKVSTNDFAKFVPKYGESLSNVRQRVKSEIENIEALLQAYNLSITTSASMLSEDVLSITKEQASHMTSILPALKEYLKYLGEEEKGGRNKRDKLIEERIKVIDQMNKKYKELNKTLSRTEALQGAFDAYKDAFADAYGRSDVRQMTAEEFAKKVLNFPNENDIVKWLDDLAKTAKNKEDKIKVELAKGEYVFDMKVRVKEESDKALIDQIEDMFSGYEMSIELQKLNIPPDLAKQLFNVDSLTLPELKDKVVSMESQFVGTNMEEEYRKFLKKIDEMEEKAQMERLKKYTQYLVKAQSERVKIKLEEMRQLAEIEKLGYTDTQKQQINQAIQLETQQKLDKEAWNSFKNTDFYIQMFEDLGVVSGNVLDDLQKRLIDMRGSLSDLSPQELKEVVAQLERVTSEQISRNPFENLSETVNKGVKALKRLKEEQEAYNNATKNQQSTQDKIDSLQIDIQAAKNKQKEASETLKSATATKEQKEEAMALLATSSLEIVNNEKTLDVEIKRLAAQKGITEEAAKKLILTRQEVSELNKTANSVGAWGSTITDSVSQVTSMLENWGIDFGEEFEGVLSGLGQAFGALENIDLTKPMSVISGVTGVVAGLGNAFASIFGFGNKDKKKEKQIQREIKFVEDLERTYQKLEKAIDNAYSINTLQASGQAAKKNVDAQIASYNKMIAAEEAKKKTDKDRIKEWQLAIEDLIEQKAELDKELVSVATSGIMDDVLSASQEFTNAWLEAFNETGDGLSGLEENFKSTMLEMVKQQAAMLISQAYVDRWKKQLEQYINPDDLELSTDEAKKWVDAVSNSLPQLNDALTRYFEAMKQAGVDLSGGGQNELSGLQLGIQSVTEETAQIIEAYLNSIRFFVAEQTTYLSQIASSFGNTEMENPMVEQLRIIASQTTAINTLLQSLTRGGHTLGGVGLKVFIS